MSITAHEYETAEYMLRPAADHLRAVVWPDRRGKRPPDPLILLMGLHFAIKRYGTATVSAAYHVLTTEMPRDLQWRLGIRTSAAGEGQLLPIDCLYAMTKRMVAKLDYTEARQPGLSVEERTRREKAIERFCALALAPTLPPRPAGSVAYAVDGTGIQAFERPPKKVKAEPEQDGHEEDLAKSALLEPPADDGSNASETPAEPTLPGPPEPASEDGDAEPADGTPSEEGTATDGKAAKQAHEGKGLKGASDARWGWRTAKTGGRENFYGYDLEALIRVPAIGQTGAQRTEPFLVAGIRVLPASTDIVAPVLGLIDDVKGRGERIKELIVDRHYSYKAAHRWFDELQRRGIAQICDLHENDQGFTDWDGIKIAASHPHCPETPDDLGTIPTLPPKPTDKQREEYDQKIQKRKDFALQWLERPTFEQPRMKLRCPALNGSVGCPRRDSTVAAAIELGQQVVEPKGEPIPICVQKSVSLRIETPDQKRAMKVMQPDYWGDPMWRESYNRRTYVEGFFGCLKNPAIAGVGKDISQFRGLAMTTLLYALATAIGNAHALGKWHEATGDGDPEHPLLRRPAPFYGFAELTDEQALAVDLQALEPTQTLRLPRAS